MNIKQAETLSGVSKRNIRFYEQKNLISPARNAQNDYRDYSQKDIETLKIIRALRMIDMPLEQIHEVLCLNITLKEAASFHETHLRKKMKEMETAIHFCQELQTISNPSQIHMILEKMDDPKIKRRLFHQWKKDYQTVSHYLQKKTFTFVPDEPITNKNEFTLALCKFGTKHNLNLVITKESMYPEFTIDGIEYVAERFYTSTAGVPTATIHCHAKYPDLLKPDLPNQKIHLFSLLHYGWILLPLLLIVWFGYQNFNIFSSWEGVFLFICTVIAEIAGLAYYLILYYNNKE